MFCIAGLLWEGMAGQVGSEGTGGLSHSGMSQKSSLSWQPKICDTGLLVWAGGHWLSVGISSCRAASSEDLDELSSDQE